MALREILSSQAASAAVTVPVLDAAQDTSKCDPGSDANLSGSLNGRGFDLDLNAGVEEDKGEVKKVKAEVGSDVPNSVHGESWPSRAGKLTSKELKPVLDLNELDLNEEVKEEPCALEKVPLKEDPYPLKTEGKILSRQLVPKLPNLDDILVSLPKDSKASKLVTVARESWAANLEFIQDCTIRFLCVFALDR